MHRVQPYLISYDIRCPQRLMRLHKFLRKQALHVQYSVFITERDSRSLADLTANIRMLINERVDDVRIYPLPNKIDVRTLGRISWPHQLGMHLRSIEPPDAISDGKDDGDSSDEIS